MTGIMKKDLMNDCEDDRNIELRFDDISSISFTEKDWGSSLQLEYQKDGKDEKFQIFNSTRLGEISCKKSLQNT